MPTTFLDLPDCHGTLNWGDGSLLLHFSVRCDNDGTLAILFRPLAANEQTSVLLRQCQTSGIDLPQCSLTGRASTGENIFTEHAWITSCHVQPTANAPEFHLAIDCGSLRIEQPIDDLDLKEKSWRYWVSGLRCSRVVRAAFDFGTVEIHGAITSIDTLDGLIHVSPKNDSSTDQVDEGIDRVITILSMASGQLLTWTMRQRFTAGVALHAQRQGSLHIGWQYPVVPGAISGAPNG